MAYFFNSNEEVEFKSIGGRLYLYLIHRDHSHDGMCPHAHVLDITHITFGDTDVDPNDPRTCRNLNTLCGEAKKNGKVISYR